MQEFQDSRMSSLISVLTSVPRATQLLDKEPNHILLVNSLEHEFKHYLQQVYRHAFQQDKRYKSQVREEHTQSLLTSCMCSCRDPDITFFDQMNQPVVMYR